MGRHTKLTPVVHGKIIGYLGADAYLEHAAEAVGVGRATVYDWLRRGEADEPEEPYASFAADVRKAQAESVVRSLIVISKAEQSGDWKAAAWKLERKHPKLFAQTSRHELTGKDGGEISISPTRIEIVAPAPKPPNDDSKD
jgi:transposase